MATERVIRILGHGIHDHCPKGHEDNFHKAKHAFPKVHLIVGLIDVEVREPSSKLLYSEMERHESLLHCRHVDEVISNVPWTIDEAFLKQHNIDYVTITDAFYKEEISELMQEITQSEHYLDIDTLKPLQAEPESIAPFSDDPLAIKKRNECDYDFNNRIKLSEARDVSTSRRSIRVYADGIYDMFHPGHARQLKQAKEAFPNVHLMVGCVNDELTLRNKGPTLVPENLRYNRIRHCRYVDEVIRDAPWVLTEDFLIANKIDFVAHDDLPYKFEGQEDVYKHIKELGMFLATQRMVGISTTDLKKRLK